MTQEELSIGVDMGGTSIKFAVVQGTQIVYKAEPMQTTDYASPDAIVEEIGKRLRAIMELYPAVKAVGMGLPGFVDHKAGVVDSLTNVPGWYDIHIRDILSDATGLPAAVDNDANCMAYAEWKLGAGRGMNDLVCLTLGTGIGGCIVVHDRMLRGRNVSCAELGQTSIHYAGRVGPFGNRGAVEEYIGNNEFAADAAAAYTAAGIPRQAQECAPHLLAQAALRGDALALQQFRNYAEKLACLIMNLTYALVPEAIIIGGGVAQAGDLLFTPLRQALKKQLFPVHYDAMRLLPAHFGADSGLIGAGLMAVDYAHGKLF